MRRIQLRLGLALAGLVALVVVGAGAFVERGLREQDHAASLQLLEARARVAAEALGPLPLAVDPAFLDRLSRVAAASRARITLIGPDGVVLADSEVGPAGVPRLGSHGLRPEVRAANEGRIGTDTRRSHSTGSAYLYLGLPASPDGVVLRVAQNLASAEATAAARRRTLLQAGIVAVLLALGLGTAAASWMLRPLAELRDVLAGLSRGELHRRLAWSSRDEFGEVARVINRMADELRARIQDLTGEKEQLGAVLNGMVEGVLVVDREGRIVLANPRLRELFGVWGDVAGRPALEVIRRTDVEQAIADAAVSERPVALEVEAGEGGDRQVEMHAVRFPAAGEQLGTVAVFHDVTEIRRLERVRSEFVANVSHELRTPLTAILGFAETLQGEGLSDEQRAQYLDIIRSHATRLRALIEDLLELSRIEGRQEPVARTEVDPESLARGLLRDLEPRLAACGIEASLHCEAPVRALADRRALEQVLSNLLDNAIKYSDPGSRLRVRIGADGSRVRIDVSDDGIGIPEADQSRIFERFYRVSKARARDLGGTGLGLSIVKHLVHATGGEVFVESQEGKGTTFSVLLPAV